MIKLLSNNVAGREGQRNDFARALMVSGPRSDIIITHQTAKINGGMHAEKPFTLLSEI